MRAPHVGEAGPHAAAADPEPPRHVEDVEAQQELEELRQAEQDNSRAGISEEIGDLLFTIANLARHLGVDPEEALRASNAKFTRRFNDMEAELQNRGRAWDTLSPEAMEELWQSTKQAIRKENSE